MQVKITPSALIAAAVLLFAAGLFNGLCDALQFHYEKTGISKDNTYWNPAISWKNKYKNCDPEQGPAFPLSTTALVFITDAWHLFKMLQMLAVKLVIALFFMGYIPRSKTDFLWMLAVLATQSVVLAMGFHIFYSLIFN